MTKANVLNSKKLGKVPTSRMLHHHDILNSKIGESSHFKNASSPSSPWQIQKPVLRIKDEKVPLLLNGKNGKDYYCIYSKSQCGRWGAQIKGGAHEYQNKSTAQNPKIQVPPSLLLWREQLVLVVAVVGWLHCCVNHLCVDVAVEGTLTAASTAYVLLLLMLWGLCGCANHLCCCWCLGDSMAVSTAYVLLLLGDFTGTSTACMLLLMMLLGLCGCRCWHWG